MANITNLTQLEIKGKFELINLRLQSDLTLVTME